MVWPALAELRTVHGIVRDETGAAFSNALITFGAYGPAAVSPSTNTDAIGQFEIAVPPGVWWCRASAPEPPYTRSDYADVNLCDSDAQVNLTIRRNPANALIGGICLTAVGAAAVGAPVSVTYSINGTYFNLQTNAATNGVFSFPVFAGTWRLECGFGSTQIAVTNGELVTNLVLRAVEMPRHLTGRLQDTNGAPFEYAFITAQTETNGLTFTRVAYPDTNGQFDITACDGNWRLNVSSWFGEFDYLQSMLVIVNGTNTSNTVVLIRRPTATPTVRLTGTLLSESGNPITNAVVGAVDYGGADGAYYSANTNTDEAGRFDLRVTPGEYELYANVDSPAFNWRVMMTVKDGVDYTNLVLVSRNASTPVTVHVQDENGVPLPHAYVSAGTHVCGTNTWVDIQTDCAGNAIAQVFPGEWTLFIGATDFSTNVAYPRATKIVIAPTNAPVLVTLRTQSKSIHLTGSAVDENGHVLPDVEASAWNAEQSWRSTDGWLDLQVVPGESSLFVYSTTGRDLLFPAGTIELFSQIPHTNIQFVGRRKTVTLAGRIPELSSFETAGASVYATTTRDGLRYSSYTAVNADSSYCLRLFPGEWDIRLRKGVNTCGEANIVFIGQDVLLRDLSFGCGASANPARIIGRVVDEFGVGICSAQIWPAFATPTPEGNFEFTWPAGEVAVTAAKDEFSIGVTKWLTLTPGEVKSNIVLTLPRETLEVTAAVMSGTNEVNATFQAECELDADTIYSVRSFGDATQTMRLFSGTWTIHADDQPLNNAGFRSVPPITQSVTNGARYTFQTAPISGDPRQPNIAIAERSGTSISIRVTSQTGNNYRIEQSADLQNWTGVETTYTWGGTSVVTDTNLTVTKFYRAVLLPRY